MYILLMKLNLLVAVTLLAGARSRDITGGAAERSALGIHRVP